MESESKHEAKSKVYPKKQTFDWRTAGIKIGAFAATAFLGGVASAAGARTFNAFANSLKNAETTTDENVISISRAM